MSISKQFSRVNHNQEHLGNNLLIDSIKEKIIQYYKSLDTSHFSDIKLEFNIVEGLIKTYKLSSVESIKTDSNEVEKGGLDQYALETILLILESNLTNSSYLYYGSIIMNYSLKDTLGSFLIKRDTTFSH